MKILTTLLMLMVFCSTEIKILDGRGIPKERILSQDVHLWSLSEKSYNNAPLHRTAVSGENFQQTVGVQRYFTPHRYSPDGNTISYPVKKIVESVPAVLTAVRAQNIESCDEASDDSITAVKLFPLNREGYGKDAEDDRDKSLLTTSNTSRVLQTIDPRAKKNRMQIRAMHALPAVKNHTRKPGRPVTEGCLSFVHTPRPDERHPGDSMEIIGISMHSMKLTLGNITYKNDIQCSNLSNEKALSQVIKDSPMSNVAPSVGGHGIIETHGDKHHDHHGHHDHQGHHDHHEKPYSSKHDEYYGDYETSSSVPKRRTPFSNDNHYHLIATSKSTTYCIFPTTTCTTTSSTCSETSSTCSETSSTCSTTSTTCPTTTTTCTTTCSTTPTTTCTTTCSTTPKTCPTMCSTTTSCPTTTKTCPTATYSTTTSTEKTYSTTCSTETTCSTTCSTEKTYSTTCSTEKTYSTTCSTETTYSTTCSTETTCSTTCSTEKTCPTTCSTICPTTRCCPRTRSKSCCITCPVTCRYPPPQELQQWPLQSTNYLMQYPQMVQTMYNNGICEPLLFSTPMIGMPPVTMVANMAVSRDGICTTMTNKFEMNSGAQYNNNTIWSSNNTNITEAPNQATNEAPSGAANATTARASGALEGDDVIDAGGSTNNGSSDILIANENVQALKGIGKFLGKKKSANQNAANNASGISKNAKSSKNSYIPTPILKRIGSEKSIPIKSVGKEICCYGTLADKSAVLADNTGEHKSDYKGGINLLKVLIQGPASNSKAFLVPVNAIPNDLRNLKNLKLLSAISEDDLYNGHTENKLMIPELTVHNSQRKEVLSRSVIKRKPRRGNTGSRKGNVKEDNEYEGEVYNPVKEKQLGIKVRDSKHKEDTVKDISYDSEVYDGD